MKFNLFNPDFTGNNRKWLASCVPSLCVTRSYLIRVIESEDPSAVSDGTVMAIIHSLQTSSISFQSKEILFLGGEGNRGQVVTSTEPLT